MPVFLDNSGDGIDVGRRRNYSRRTTLQFKFCWLSFVYKGFMPLPNRESHDVSFLNASFNNAVVSLCVFFKHTQNYWSARHCSTGKSIFPNIQHNTVWWYTSVLSRTLTFFFLSSRRLLYTSAPTFLCILSGEKIVFPSLRMHNHSL